MSDHDDIERLAGLLRALPPAPAAWVQAACELPLARRGLDDIVARAAADEQFRRALVADLESALEAAGYAADPVLLEVLRERIPGS
ncbi:MAG TPA: hypothetical protein VFI37_14695 [Gaiellaceae bacterium]|jgi:hypothetical protein|nr:hypothetical protein [Gaiellaceae bacterium]